MSSRHQLQTMILKITPQIYQQPHIKTQSHVCHQLNILITCYPSKRQSYVTDNIQKDRNEQAGLD